MALRNNRILCLLLILVALFLPMTVLAASDNVHVYDNASLLTDEERDEIIEYLESLDDSINYVVLTSDTKNFGSNEDERLETYYTLTYSESDPGIAFIIDMYEREIYISGYGSISSKLTNADAYDITDNVYEYAHDGEYYKCIMTAMNQADTLINGGFILRPMRYLVTLLLSLVTGFMFVLYKAMIRRSKIKIGGEGSDIILAGASIASTAAVYNTIRTRHTSSSGGVGGGSSGGGGGGGGHSGGGHSF